MIRTPTKEALDAAAELIRRDQVVAFPTETVYGLGGSAFSDDALALIFAIKRRPANNPLIVHLASVDQLESVAQNTDPTMRRRVNALSSLWPGPLSLVLPAHPRVSRLATAGGSSVAVRIPTHEVARTLIERSGVPIAAPSANVSSSVSPTTAQHVEQSLGSAVPLILDGGPCEIGIESTVVSLVGCLPEVLRAGAISPAKIAQVLGEEVTYSGAKASHVEPQAPLACPGLLSLHYAPRTPTVLRGELSPTQYPQRTGLIAFSAESALTQEFSFMRVDLLSPSGELAEVAKNLFAAMRAQDAAGLDLIVVDTCATDGIGLAIMERLSRATSRARSQGAREHDFPLSPQVGNG